MSIKLLWSIFCFVLFCYFTNHFARYSCCNYICRNILCNNTSGTNYCIVSYGYALINMYSCTNPNIVSYLNRLGIAGSVNTLPCIHCVIRCVNTYSWSKKYIISNLNASTIQHNTIKISIKNITN